MKHFYTVPTTTLAANPPLGTWHATRAPDDPSITLVVVESWQDDDAQDAWERLAGIVEHPVWDWSGPTHARLHTAFSSHGVLAQHSTGAAMRLIRARWPKARP